MQAHGLFFLWGQIALIIGTAGHIDHGKTALVKALTGIDADRLKEEKARGITIDLGFAYKPLPEGAVLGFVDVPGHEKFIHNMLAGATGIDYVLLVVAADDGPMPQTREHLAILHLLGLSHGAVALTKTDLASAERVNSVTAEIQSLLQGTALANLPVFPVSSATGAGVAALEKYLREAMLNTPQRPPNGHFRLAVDRCFTLLGIGVVVTGTVFSGEVKLNDKLIVSPNGLPVRVRGIHAQNQAALSGRVGQRCALNLGGVEKSDIKRGDWIVAEGAHAPTACFDARLYLLAEEARPLKHWTPVHVHVGASDVAGRVALLEQNALEPGSSALAQLVLAEPVGALRGDRFIIRDQSATHTLGGGAIIDPFPPQRGRRKPQRLSILSTLESATPETALSALLALIPLGLDLQKLALAWNLTAEEAHSFWEKAPMAKATVAGKLLAFATERWQQLQQYALDALAACQKRNPDQSGATPAELRKALAERLSQPLLNAVLEALIAENKVAREGSAFRLPGHQSKLSAQDQALSEKIVLLLQTAALKAPKVRELAQQLRVEEKQLRLLLRRLAQMGKLRQVSEELFFHPKVMAQIAAATQALAQKNPGGVFTVVQFRDGTGVNRSLAIPLLEFFDRSGFTIRVGDGRKIRRDWSAVFGEAVPAQTKV